MADNMWMECGRGGAECSFCKELLVWFLPEMEHFFALSLNCLHCTWRAGGHTARLNISQEELRLLSVALETGQPLSRWGRVSSQHCASNSTFLSDPADFSPWAFSSDLRGSNSSRWRTGKFSHWCPKLTVIKPPLFIYHYYYFWRYICKTELERLSKNPNECLSSFLEEKMDLKLPCIFPFLRKVCTHPFMIVVFGALSPGV